MPVVKTRTGVDAVDELVRGEVGVGKWFFRFVGERGPGSFLTNDPPKPRPSAYASDGVAVDAAFEVCHFLWAGRKGGG